MKTFIPFTLLIGKTIVPEEKDITIADEGKGAKERRCLVCGSLFLSDWSGHRICKTCKTTSSWRSGVFYEPQTSRRKR